jgi:hypothetical protein
MTYGDCQATRCLLPGQEMTDENSIRVWARADASDYNGNFTKEHIDREVEFRIHEACFSAQEWERVP